MKKETFINIIDAVALAVFIVSVIVEATSIVQVNNRLDEQNIILKELVIACQNQATAIQQQTEMLKYDPMDENLNETKGKK